MKLLLTTAAAALVSTGAYAASIPTDFDAMISDYDGIRGFWFDGLIAGDADNGDLRHFTVSNGMMSRGGGTATLTGTIASVANNDLTFDFEVNLSDSDPQDGYCQYTWPAYNCVTGDKIMGNGDVKGPLLDQSIVDMWDFFSFDSGTLEGTGALDGFDLTLTDKTDGEHKPQLGKGANALEVGDFGFSTWFNFDSTDGEGTEVSLDGVTYVFGASGSGDINVDVNNGEVLPDNPAPVPLPAGIWLMLAGMGALGAAARARRG